MSKDKDNTQAEQMEREFFDRITITRARMLADQPFFAILSWSFKNKVDMRIPTACTDCLTEIRFNLDFMKSLTDPEFMFVYAHEVMHGAMRHNARRLGRNPRLWALACDFAINPILIQNGLRMPAHGCYNKEWAGKSADEIYEILSNMSEQQQKQAQGNGFGSGEGHMTDDPPQGGDGESGVEKESNGSGLTKEEIKTLEAKLDQAVRHAALAAQARGKLPGGIEGVIEMLEKPNVNWKPELWEFFNSISPSGFSWKRPNRRHINRNIYLPSPERREAIDTLVIAIDDSGSCWDVLEEFCAEAFAAAKAANPKRILVIWADAEVQQVDELTDIEDWKPRAKGGGGTDFRPVFRYIEDQGIEPAGLVFLTDLDGNMPKEAPPYPVLWAVGGSWWRGSKGPFGRTIEIKPKQE